MKIIIKLPKCAKTKVKITNINIMKRYKLLLLFVIGAWSFVGNAQNLSTSTNQLKEKISNKDFFEFVNSFSKTSCPYNSKRGYPRQYSTIPTKWISNYLKVPIKDMYYLVSAYDQEDEKITNTKKELKDYTRCALLYTNDFIIITYGCEYSDRIGENYYRYEHLLTFDFAGRILDSISLIHGNWISDNITEEYVLINPTHFITFKYSKNHQNIDKSTGMFINEKGFRLKCEISYYQIEGYGKIKKISTEIKYLKSDHYKTFNPQKYSDDPMNKY